MITIDYHNNKKNPLGNRKTYADDSLVSIHLLEKGETDNWGDDDCRKMVTITENCDITIAPAAAKDFKAVSNRITFLRWGYYHPAYYIPNTTKITRIYHKDGSLTLQVRAA